MRVFPRSRRQKNGEAWGWMESGNVNSDRKLASFISHLDFSLQSSLICLTVELLCAQLSPRAGNTVANQADPDSALTEAIR